MAKGDIQIYAAPKGHLYEGSLQITGPSAFIGEIKTALGALDDPSADYRTNVASTRLGKAVQCTATILLERHHLEALSTVDNGNDIKNRIWTDAVTTDNQGNVISQDYPHIR